MVINSIRRCMYVCMYCMYVCPPAVGDESAGLAAGVAGERCVPGQEHRAAAEPLHQILTGPTQHITQNTTEQHRTTRH